MGTWHIKQHRPEEIEALVNQLKVDKLLARCLLNRGHLRPRHCQAFLQPMNASPPDPFQLPGMEAATTRILQAIDKGERICIYGDYDADGVTAISILTQGLGQLGGDAFYYIPDRFFEGVGLNTQRLAALQADEGVGLVITVDTGIRAFEEMTFARSIGLDVIITDHHTPSDRLPDALAVVNPHLEDSAYPFKDLCGAGVALKLIQAMDSLIPDVLNINRYLQIAAIGTIADMVPLRDENRWIVASGLKAIASDPTSPLRALLRKVGIKGEPDAMDVSFKVAPRINAPGRLGDPDTAIRFFSMENSRELAKIVETMDGMNCIRQMLERDLEQRIETQLRHAIRGKVPPFLMLAGRYWHRGILGIMACKIMRRFKRPVCVLSFDDTTAYGSLRSLEGINLMDTLQDIKPLLTTFGGHPEAAGVTLPLTNLPQFKSRMTELLEPKLAEAEARSSFSVDAEIHWEDLGPKLFTTIRKMAPFGIGNAAPVFYSANLILESEVRRKGSWYHFEASDGSVSRKCSFYHPIELSEQFEQFDSIDLVYSITPFRDEYQLQIVEMRPSKN